MKNTIKEVKFPRKLAYISENPIISFYIKVLTKLKIDSPRDKLKYIKVNEIFVNEKDTGFLRKLLTKHVKREMPYLTKRRLDFTVGMIMLDISPAEDSTVKAGTVRIQMEMFDESKK